MGSIHNKSSLQGKSLKEERSKYSDMVLSIDISSFCHLGLSFANGTKFVKYNSCMKRAAEFLQISIVLITAKFFSALCCILRR